MAKAGYPRAYITDLHSKEALRDLYEFMNHEFEVAVAFEEREIEQLIHQHKLLKRYLVVKTILFPLELILTRLFIDKFETRAVIRRQKRIWAGLVAKRIDKETIHELYGLV